MRCATLRSAIPSSSPGAKRACPTCTQRACLPLQKLLYVEPKHACSTCFIPQVAHMFARRLETLGMSFAIGFGFLDMCVIIVRNNMSWTKAILQTRKYQVCTVPVKGWNPLTRVQSCRDSPSRPFGSRSCFADPREVCGGSDWRHMEILSESRHRLPLLSAYSVDTELHVCSW